jgi:hypothetical protein
VQERILKEAVVDESMHYPGICLEGLRKTTINLKLDDAPPGLENITSPIQV